MALPFVLISGSCIFDLPPVADDEFGTIGGSAGIGNLGGATSGASGGEQGGAAGVGGAAGSVDVPNPCPDGQKRCGDGSCRPATVEFGCGSSACEPCASAAHAVAGCVEGQCVFTSCEPNYADCNGDTLSGPGPSGSDGCEYLLGAPSPSSTSLQVPFAHIQVDGKLEDWSTVPAYGFDQLCSNCRDQQTPPVRADSTVPPRNDLDARFRVAWDVDKFYLLVEAFDEQLYDTGVAGGSCQQSADCEDGAQLILLGRDDRSHAYFSDNERIFLGSSGSFGAPAQGQPSSSDLEIKIARPGKLCYRIEAQVDWAYITNTKSNSGAAPGHFPPAPGQSYGFDIAVNDWDAPISDPNAIERQSQVFFTSPGSDFDFATKTDGIGSMTLTGPDAGL